MELYDACKLAMAYYEEVWGTRGLAEIKDLGRKWLFYPISEENYYGDGPITISKMDGEIELFHLPDEENFMLLKSCNIIDVPNEFK